MNRPVGENFRCQYCKWFEDSYKHFGDAPRVTYGRCLRFPPQSGNKRPEVSVYDFCGEFERKVK